MNIVENSVVFIDSKQNGKDGVIYMESGSKLIMLSEKDEDEYKYLYLLLLKNMVYMENNQQI